MNRSIFTLALCSAGALALVACGDDPRPTTDSGPVIMIDGGPDTDGGPPGDRPAVDRPPTTTCDVGDPCDPTRGCPRSPFCIDEFDGEIGGAADPIMGLPGGGTGIPYMAWVGGYCSTVEAVDSGGCDPLDEMACGGPECGTCLNSGQVSMTGSPVTYCTRTCAPSLTSNPCRDTYACILGNNVCVPGCGSDDECRVRRDDTNDNMLNDPYDAMMNPGGDRLIYDSSTNATCNTATFRCLHDGGGGEAGDICHNDFDCEQNGDCIPDDGEEGNWPGGYCTKFGCDVAGNECAGDGKCQERGLGIYLCVQACQVAATTDPADRFSNARDCRPGYSCFWDGEGGPVPDNGGCVPGDYNSVTTPNVGSACTDASTCYSPYGLGQCRDFGAGNHCTLFDCGAPGVPTDVCGTNAVCAQVTGSTTTLCIQTCTTAADCLAGNGCWDTTMAGITTGGESVCFPGCLENSHCRTGESCVGATAMMVGECM
jgi:hypothetical protein